MSELVKPTKVVSEPRWVWLDCINYIKAKYSVDTNNFAGYKFDGSDNSNSPYYNFWHWLTDNPWPNIHNGSLHYLDVKYYLNDQKTPEWVKSIFQMIFLEFQEDEMYVWISW